MAKIRIIKTPPGAASESIRQQWVGAEIPLASEQEQKRLESSPNWSNTGNGAGYIVAGDAAVRALEKLNRPEAAQYWGTPQPPTYMRFSKGCCELLA